MKKSKDNLEMKRYYQSPMEVRIPWWAKFLDRFLENPTREEIASSFSLKGSSCLDLACGDGELINRYLHKRYKKLVGIDISEKEISLARKQKAKNAEFYVADVKTFLKKAILKKELFDDVYMLAFLEHIDWPVEVLTLISNILNKNGRLVI